MNELERRGHSLLAEGHSLLAKAAQLRGRAVNDDWLPVGRSPLGRRKTLELARRGVIDSAKVGRKVIVRATSLNAFIEGNRRITADENLFGRDTKVPQSRCAPGTQAR